MSEKDLHDQIVAGRRLFSELPSVPGKIENPVVVGTGIMRPFVVSFRDRNSPSSHKDHALAFKTALHHLTMHTRRKRPENALI